MKYTCIIAATDSHWNRTCARRTKNTFRSGTWVAEKLTSSPFTHLCVARGFSTRKPGQHWEWCCLSHIGYLFSCVQMRRQIVCVTSYLPSAHIVMQDIDCDAGEVKFVGHSVRVTIVHTAFTPNHTFIAFEQYYAWHFWIRNCDIGISQHLKRRKMWKKWKMFGRHADTSHESINCSLRLLDAAIDQSVSSQRKYFADNFQLSVGARRTHASHHQGER